MLTNVLPNDADKLKVQPPKPIGITGQPLLYNFEPPMPQNHWELIQFIYVHLLQTTARAYTAKRIDDDVRTEVDNSFGDVRDVCEFYGIDVGRLEAVLLRQWAKDDEWLAAKLAKYLSRAYQSSNERLYEVSGDSSGAQECPPYPGGFYNPYPEIEGGE